MFVLFSISITLFNSQHTTDARAYMDRVKRIWYLSPMRAAKVQASLRIRAVSPEPSLLAHTSSESRGTFRQKTRSLAPLNGWACAVEICHDGMLEDTNSLDAAHMVFHPYFMIGFHWYRFSLVNDICGANKHCQLFEMARLRRRNWKLFFFRAELCIGSVFINKIWS